MNNRTAYILHAARGPVLLITVGVLFALHQADILRFRLTWPILIIMVGVMKLLERMVAPRAVVAPPSFTPPYPGQYPQQPPYPPPPPPSTPGAGPFSTSGPGGPFPGGTPR